jgi:hypothetical protein
MKKGKIHEWNVGRRSDPKSARRLLPPCATRETAASLACRRVASARCAYRWVIVGAAWPSSFCTA